MTERTRQIFRAMHCYINFTRNQLSLDFGREQAFAPSVRIFASTPRHAPALITTGLDNFSLDLQFRPSDPQGVLRHSSLRQRQLAATRTENNLVLHQTSLDA